MPGKARHTKRKAMKTTLHNEQDHHNSITTLPYAIHPRRRKPLLPALHPQQLGA
jgi:hypothetical protein